LSEGAADYARSPRSLALRGFHSTGKRAPRTLHLLADRLDLRARGAQLAAKLVGVAI
jgi:hypothetical protein